MDIKKPSPVLLIPGVKNQKLPKENIVAKEATPMVTRMKGIASSELKIKTQGSHLINKFFQCSGNGGNLFKISIVLCFMSLLWGVAGTGLSGGGGGGDGGVGGVCGGG